MSYIDHGFKRCLCRSVLSVVLVSIMTACVTASSPASAHVHHSAEGSTISWYPIDCCHDGDCHPVARVRVLSSGLLMTTEDGTTLFVNSGKARRPSLDSRWHVCFGANENPDVRCIFEPPNS